MFLNNFNKITRKLFFIELNNCICGFSLQKFEVKDWPKDDYGKFFEGDSYIILNVSKMLLFFCFFCFCKKYLTLRLLDSFLKKCV